MSHPEVDGSFGELNDFVNTHEAVDVWCNGCKAWRKMNASYAKVLKTGEIDSCGVCRQ